MNGISSSDPTRLHNLVFSLGPLLLAIDVLFSLLAEFDDEVRSKHDGLREVFAGYERWLNKHEIS